MPTIDEVRAKIRKNFPKEGGSRDGTLKWDRETATSMVSSCGRYRIGKASDGKGTFDYSAFTVPGPAGASRKIAGPYLTAKECRDAVQDFVNGEPMQAHL